MEFKGTKGNWILRENQCTVMSDENCLIARVFDGKGTVLLEHKEQSDEIVYANAKLIANAPDMLNVLKEIMESYEENGQLLYFDINKVRKVLEETLT